jgi:hypothetical protein
MRIIQMISETDRPRATEEGRKVARISGGLRRERGEKARLILGQSNNTSPSEQVCHMRRCEDMPFLLETGRY